jgi:hypothetical protein
MKKKSDHKLGLNRETVRHLDRQTVEQAWGGSALPGQIPIRDTIVRPSDACGTPTSG